MTGPKLGGVLDKEPYSGDVKKIVNWVHNADKLTSTDPYYKGLKAQFGTQMTAFPALPDKDIEAIVKYVSTPVAAPTLAHPPQLQRETEPGSSLVSFHLSWQSLP